MGIRLAMVNAIAQYQEPLKDLESWKGASTYWARALSDINWAEALRKRGESERNHQESPEEKPLPLNQDVEGRLGFAGAFKTRDVGSYTIHALLTP